MVSRPYKIFIRWYNKHPLWYQISQNLNISLSFSLNFESFVVILEYFSYLKIDVDTFVDFWNRKCDLYFSRFIDEYAAGVNFFAQELKPLFVYYAFPPPSLIVPAMEHFYKFKSIGLIVFPIWKSASFCTLFSPEGKHLPIWAKQFLNFLPSGFVKSEWVLSHTFSNPPHFEMGVLHFDFNV